MSDKTYVESVMTQTGQVTVADSSTATIYPKTDANLMSTQMNVKQGLIKYGEKVNQAIIKEL